MNLIDTHSHIYQEDFDEDIEEVINRASQTGVNRILLPNIDLDSIDRMHRLVDAYPSYCLPMMGLHPTSAKADFQEQLDQLRPWFSKRNYIAVGEIGIDLYWDTTFFKEQQEAFERQLQWSIDLDLPVVIHNREAFEPIMNSIEKTGSDRLRGVFHSFGGTKEELDRILSLKGFYVGINGVVTFKNARLSESLEACPLDRIVVETDAPYLSPVPFRGKRNESAYIVKTVEKLAGIFQITPEDVGEWTTRNAKNLFGL